MKKMLLHIALLFLFVGNLNAQSKKDFVDLGDNAFFNAEYYTASYYYEQALEMDSTDISLIEKNAKAHYFFHNYRAAAKWYQYLVDINQAEEISAQAFFYLGESLRCLEEYEKAKKAFESCISATKKPDLLETAKQRSISCDFAIKHLNDSTNAVISQLPSKINSAYSENNPNPLSDSALVFSSLRPLGEFNPHSILETASFSRLYISKMGGSGWGTPKNFSDQIISQDAHIANATFSNDYKKIFFTLCDGGNLECQIYYSEFENGKWSKAKALPKEINISGYTNTQPHYYQGEEFDILYFVSDRPGGFGKLDIWYSIFKDKKFYAPTNVGSNINTPGNEITPFYSSKQGLLFFSSDWHAGFGGYDIFKSKGKLNQWTKVENLMPPINSSCHDFNYITNPFDTNAYIASNRPGSYYLKGESCCYDIYNVEYKEEEVIYVYTPEDTVKEDSIVRSIKDLLPISIYFHNDEPNPRTTLTKTDKNYSTTYYEYIAMIDKYKEEFSKSMTGLEKMKAEKDVEDFFNFYVKTGYYNLELFASYLLADLERGRNVELNVKGFCSPLNTTAYNINLAKRRISSLIVYLEEYQGGVFLPYLRGKAENGAKLIIYKDPIGKSMSNPFVSDDPNDARNSIYSREAAYERKVQIIMYQSAVETSSIHFEKTEFDLGTVSKNSKMELEIPFSNKGKAALQISSVEVQNPSTSYDLDKKVLNKDETAYLNLRLETGNISGYHQEVISIFSSDSSIKSNIIISYYVED